MKEQTQAILREARGLLAGEDVSQIFLFGSRAREVEDSDSDVDLIVILNRKEPFSSFMERSATIVELRKRLFKLSSMYGLDLLVFTKADWDHFIQGGSSFSKEILDEARDVA